MRQVWEMAIPDPGDGQNPQASPLRGDLNGLPPHLMFVAGQDPLRDEGIAYAKKLKESGMKTTLHICSRVPYIFGEIWELESTKRFINDLVKGCAPIT